MIENEIETKYAHKAKPKIKARKNVYFRLKIRVLEVVENKNDLPKV